MSTDRNKNLSNTLRQSLQSVLMDESLEDISSTMMGPPSSSQIMNDFLQTNRERTSSLLSNFPPPRTTSAHQDHFAGLLGPKIGKTSLGGLASLSACGGLPSTAPAFGLSSSDLLYAAVVEKRMLDQARANLLRQQQALAEGEKLKRQIYNESLRSMWLQNLMKPSAAAIAVPQSQPSTQDTKKDIKETLATLGSSLRTNAPYIDVSIFCDPDTSEDVTRKTRGGVVEQFPEKLHRMLEEVEESGDTDIISFFSHGRAFRVHDADRFVSEIMPKYFKQSRLCSFLRQLNLYGFTRINSGPDNGGYYHELFLKGRPALSMHMRRVGVPKGEDRRKNRSLQGTQREPDFYSMKAIGSGK